MIGERLGGWIIEAELGRGGMGNVWRASRAADVPGEPPFAAIKVLAPELATEPGFLDRFRREIEVLSQLDHPHITRFLETGSDRGHVWFAMELVEGPSLETVRTERGRLPWRDVLHFALQVAPALKHAHDRGIIHRDLKPSNLLLAPGNVIKLTDFGIASLFAGRQLTVPGSVVGTAEYLSPEQAAGKPVTPRSDLYSLGVVLYVLLTGRTPFEGEVIELLHKHRYGQFELPSRLVSDLPGEFEDILCGLMEKDPAKRPHDAGVLTRRLDALRRRMHYKAREAAAEAAGIAPSATSAGDTPSPIGTLGGGGGEGPATLMSRLMRAELERQNRGGPIKRFFNHPMVVLTLFLLCAGTIAWAFWPQGPEDLFRKGAELMASDNSSDWERGWDDYLSKLDEKYPDHGHKAELAEYRKRIDDLQARRKSAEAARRAGAGGEPEWFYREALRLRQRGDEAGARKAWQGLIDAFGDVPSEEPWVRKARAELEKDGVKEARQWAPVRAALRKAHELRAEGKVKEADAIVKALDELYRDDPAARAVLQAEK